jgi:hypothetical protein
VIVGRKSGGRKGKKGSLGKKGKEKYAREPIPQDTTLVDESETNPMRRKMIVRTQRPEM